jgi:carbon dioxide concentrating mechanism protein CcmK
LLFRFNFEICLLNLLIKDCLKKILSKKYQKTEFSLLFTNFIIYFFRRTSVMAIAVGMIETLGFPAVVEAADAMVKAARVTLVGYEKIGSGRVTVIVRGDVSEVQASVAAGMESVKRVNGGQVLSTHIIARPHENLEYVLPIRYTEEVDQFRDNVNSIRPMNRP